GRSEINFMATSFDASKRLGLKSSANILPEISIEITMSIPSVVTSCQLNELCGRAMAKIKAANPNILNKITEWRKCGNLVFARLVEVEIFTVPCNFRFLKIYQANKTGRTVNNQKYAGFAND